MTKPRNRMDLDHLMRRAIDSYHAAATGAVIAQGKQGMISCVVLTAAAGAAATLTLETEGSGGTTILTAGAAQGTSAVIPFPSGLYFSDGVYATLGGAGAALDVVGVADAS